MKILILKKSFLKQVLCLVGILISTLVSAKQTIDGYKYTLQKTPRLYLQAYTGDNLLGRADLLVPLYLTNTQALFLYGQGRVSDQPNLDYNPWVLSGAIGYRTIYQDRALFGAYLFADYSQIVSREGYWDLSPGVEVLGKVWDFRANGYFPISTKTSSEEGFASDFGIYDYVRFQDNSTKQWGQKFDEWVRLDISRHMAMGTDAEVGRKLFRLGDNLIKGYLGGYYFNAGDEGDILGVGARVTLQPSSFVTFSANDTYDKYTHNTFMLSMRVRLNDLFSRKINPKVTEDRDLSVRLLDPVERNLGAIESAVNPIHSHTQTNLEGERLKTDFLWFFDGTKTNFGNGTYTNPFSYFQYNQGTFDYIHLITPQEANIYYNHGRYFSGDVFGKHGDKNGVVNANIDLYAGQSDFGRTENYVKSAEGEDRALIVGSLTLPGNNIIDSMRVINLQTAPTLNHQVGVVDGYGGVVKIVGSNVTIGNSDVSATAEGGTMTAVNIADSVNNVNINNSTISATVNNADTGNLIGSVVGVYLGKNSSLLVQNSSVIASAIENSSDTSWLDDENNAFGILGVGENDTLTVDNSRIRAVVNMNYDTEAGCAGLTDSSNAYGILMGENNYSERVNGIFGNTLTIRNHSIVEGLSSLDLYSTAIGQVDLNLNSSGNAYGVVVGYGADEDNNYSDPINNNSVTIDHSTLTGQNTLHADAVAGVDENLSESGNGYGMLVGYGWLYDSQATSNNLAVSGNTININNSSLTGEAFSNANDLDYSGNAYGLMIGYGSALTAGPADVSIVGNSININNGSVLTGQTSDEQELSGGQNSLHGYGFLLGYGYLGNTGSTFNSAINSNRVSIISSSLTGQSSAQTDGSLTDIGNSYGLLIGYNYVEPGDVSTKNVDNNTVTVNSSTLTAKSLGNSGKAYGINFGANAAEASSNVLTVTNSTFNIQRPSGLEGWGIWVANGFGTLDYLTGNIFNNLGVGSAGGEVLLPSGTSIGW